MQNFGGNNNRFVRGGQGGGGFGQGRKGGRGRGGRGGRGRGNNNNNNSGQGGSGQGQGQGGGGGGQGIKQLCIHFLRGACNQGDNCRYSHDISVVTNIPQVGGDIKAIAINSTGSIFVAAGQSIQVYDTSSGSINCSGSRDFEGLIHHIEAIDSYLVVGYDYPPSQFPGNTVGLVTVLDIQNNQSYQLIRSDSIPYTHPVRVSKFIVEKFGDDIYVFTCGTEGMIHVWCFNPTTSSVSHAFGLEGHIREVSSLALQGNYLWSGSHDFTLKIWDLNSRDICLTFRPPENENFENSPESGHSAGVTCITKVLVGSDLYVVTSSNDGYVIIWNGDQKYYDFGEQDGVTALSSAHDLSGEPIIILGLQNGFIVIRRWTNPEEFILLDKPGLKHNGPVYSITQLAPGVIATGGGDQSIHVWKIDKPLFN